MVIVPMEIERWWDSLFYLSRAVLPLRGSVNEIRVGSVIAYSVSQQDPDDLDTRGSQESISM
ncbi:MAG: hypothetical protein ACR2N1_07585 [Rubripirellula sp.]